MRSFARDIDLSPAFLTRVLAGTRRIGVSRADAMAHKLSWETPKRWAFLAMVRLESTKSDLVRTEITREIEKLTHASSYQLLELEIFAAISEWHHNAIIELITLNGFVDNPVWIAKQLQISEVKVVVAMDRLCRLGLIKVDGEKFVPASPCFSTGDIPAESIRKFHKGMLSKASLAIDKQHPDVRDFSGVTVAVDVEKIPEAKALIKKFRRELVQLVNCGQKTQVYHLAVQFFSVMGAKKT